MPALGVVWTKVFSDNQDVADLNSDEQVGNDRSNLIIKFKIRDVSYIFALDKQVHNKRYTWNAPSKICKDFLKSVLEFEFENNFRYDSSNSLLIT